jgi:hypothetical protein
MGVSGQHHVPAALLPPGTHCTGGWVGPRVGLDTEDRGKILCPRRGSNPDRQVVQPVVRHYTAWANPAPYMKTYITYLCGERIRWGIIWGIPCHFKRPELLRCRVFRNLLLEITRCTENYVGMTSVHCWAVEPVGLRWSPVGCAGNSITPGSVAMLTQ